MNKELERYKKCIDLEEAEFISTHNMSVIETDTYNQLVRNSQAFDFIQEEFMLHVYEFMGQYFLTTRYGDKIQITKQKFNLLKGVLQ